MTNVRYSYLPQQFADPSEILDRLRALVGSGDFTLGQAVAEFESRFAKMIGVNHAIGVGSGTDALKLPLKALGLGFGDEVITAANTFIATVGAINEIGARPVLIDCDDGFCMNAHLIEAAITENTKAIMPVHLTGNVAEMDIVMEIAGKHGLYVVEDACQGILSEYKGTRSGAWGIAAGFSLHPLKNLNVWGDGGIVVTNDADLDRRLRLIRNHGMENRDEISMLGYNSRLDSVHAVVGNWLIGDTTDITSKRIENAAYYDRAFSDIPGIRIPARHPDVKHVYHLYMVFADDRDALLEHCLEAGIEAKVHYPIPLYQQAGLRFLGYQASDFPVTDRHAKEIISFPVDQHISTNEMNFVIETVGKFYAAK